MADPTAQRALDLMAERRDHDAEHVDRELAELAPVLAGRVIELEAELVQLARDAFAIGRLTAQRHMIEYRPRPGVRVPLQDVGEYLARTLIAAEKEQEPHEAR